MRFKGSPHVDTDHMVLVPNDYKRSFERFNTVEIDGKEVLFEEYVERENGNIEKCCSLVKMANALKEQRVQIDEHVTFLFADYLPVQD